MYTQEIVGLIPGVEYDKLAIAISPDTVETYTYTKNAATVAVVVITYVDNTRADILTAERTA